MIAFRRMCMSYPLRFTVLVCIVCATHVQAYADSSRASKSVRSIARGSELSKRQMLIEDSDFPLSVPAGIGSATTPTRLHGWEYECVFATTLAEATREIQRTMYCYEIRTASEQSHYSWALWSPHPLIRMRLFGNAPGENFLAWVDGDHVFFEEVTRARTREAALARYLSGEDRKIRFAVPVTALAGEEPFLSLWGRHYDITPLGIRQDAEGNLEVQVKGGHTGEEFTFVWQDGKWQSDE
jgi:hypothetical protein